VAESFECARDGGPWTACSPPIVQWGLPLGPGPEFHVLAVRGVSVAAGPDPSPAEWRWLHVADLLAADGFESPPSCE
jgi:hypothetical protein